MKLGDNLNGIVADAANGVPAAQAVLDTAPQITTPESLYWRAFETLKEDRPDSLNGLRLISWTVLTAYAKHHGMTYNETERFLRIIRDLDIWYVNYLNSRASK